MRKLVAQAVLWVAEIIAAFGFMIAGKTNAEDIMAAKAGFKVFDRLMDSEGPEDTDQTDGAHGDDAFNPFDGLREALVEMAREARDEFLANAKRMHEASMAASSGHLQALEGIVDDVNRSEELAKSADAWADKVLETGSNDSAVKEKA
jgi:hypothetical protein